MIDFCGVVEVKGEQFIALVAESDLDLPVPCCPGWGLRNLAIHQGRTWEWARQCLSAGRPMEEDESAVDDAELVPWLADQLGQLVRALREADPAAPTWTFGPEPRTAGFWRRRQAHEVTVHLWDAQSAIEAPEPIDEVLAADGVAEVFEVFLPRQVRLERMAAVEDGVRITLPDGRSFDLGTTVVAEVTADPSTLLLALWHRVPLGALDVTGDREAAQLAFDRALTP